MIDYVKELEKELNACRIVNELTALEEAKREVIKANDEIKEKAKREIDYYKELSNHLDGVSEINYFKELMQRLESL